VQWIGECVQFVNLFRAVVSVNVTGRFLGSAVDKRISSLQ